MIVRARDAARGLLCGAFALSLLCACEEPLRVVIPHGELELPARARLLHDGQGDGNAAAVQLDGFVVAIVAREATRAACREALETCAWFDADAPGPRPSCLHESRARRGRWRVAYERVEMPDPSRVEVRSAACDDRTLVTAGASTDDEAAAERAEASLRELWRGLPP